VSKNSAVLQEWVCTLSWKKQTVLIGAIRAPDLPISTRFKQVCTWLRSQILENADPTTGFMRDALLPGHDGEIAKEFERLPLHCGHHLLLAMQVLSIDHPDKETRIKAWGWFARSLSLQHVNPETLDQYEARYV
jgi:hypothetical protein